jgi:hypothetical protein
MREDTRGRVGRWTTGNGALEVLKAWCEVRTGRTPGPLDVAEERRRPCGAQWGHDHYGQAVGEARSRAVNSPACVEEDFCELRLYGVLGSSHRALSAKFRCKILHSLAPVRLETSPALLTDLLCI